MLINPYRYVSGSTGIVDSQSEVGNQGTWMSVHSSRLCGQAISIPSEKSLTSAKFYLKKSGSPTGSCYAYIYATTGTVGSNAKGTGSALATSDAVDVSTISGAAYSLVEFTFTPYARSGDTAILFGFLGGGTSDYVEIGYVNPVHAGNPTWYTTTWQSDSGGDIIFYLYGS